MWDTHKWALNGFQELLFFLLTVHDFVSNCLLGIHQNYLAPISKQTPFSVFGSSRVVNKITLQGRV